MKSKKPLQALSLSSLIAASLLTCSSTAFAAVIAPDSPSFPGFPIIPEQVGDWTLSLPSRNFGMITTDADLSESSFVDILASSTGSTSFEPATSNETRFFVVMEVRYNPVAAPTWSLVNSYFGGGPVLNETSQGFNGATRQEISHLFSPPGPEVSAEPTADPEPELSGIGSGSYHDIARALVPEPSSALLFLSSALGLLSRRKRNQSAACSKSSR